jgi:hypothetical protein
VVVIETVYRLQVGDLEELKAVTLAFSKDRKTPLLRVINQVNHGAYQMGIGSLRCHQGHHWHGDWLHTPESALQQHQRGC